jgi:transposase-like protein
MTFIVVHCLRCRSEQRVTRGQTRRGTQRYLCQNSACTQGSFLLDYRNRGCLAEVKQQIVDMSLNASGVGHGMPRLTKQGVTENTDIVGNMG